MMAGGVRTSLLALVGFGLSTSLSLLLSTGARATPNESGAAETRITAAPQSLAIKPQKIKRTTVTYKFDAEGISENEGTTDAAGGRLGTNLALSYTLTPSFLFFFEPRVQFWSGRSQLGPGHEDDSSRLLLSEAYLKSQFRFADAAADIRIGVHSQKHWDAKGFVSSYRSFPGLRESVQWNFGDTTLSVSAQQVIPTSSSDVEQRSEKEVLPSLFAEQIHLQTNNLLQNFSFTSALTHFGWNALPAKVAAESSLGGNTVIGGRSPISRFASSFNSVSLLVGGEYRFSERVHLGLQVERGANLAAPEETRDMEVWKVGPRFNFAQHEITLEYAHGFFEPDFAPAYYAKSSTLNRLRQALEASMKFKKYGFSLHLGAAQTQVLNPNGFQQNSQQFLIGVETDHVEL